MRLLIPKSRRTLVFLIRHKQLRREQKKEGKYYLPPKNDKPRTITPAPWVMKLLKTHRASQSELRLKAEEVWADSGLVFTDEMGRLAILSHVV